jgi:hypothetical protein
MPARKLAKRIKIGDLHKMPNAKRPQTTATAQNSQTKLHVFSTLLEANLDVASLPQCTTGDAKFASPLIADVMTAAWDSRTASSLLVISGAQEPPGETLAMMALACCRQDEAVAEKVVNVATIILTAFSKEPNACVRPVSHKKMIALASTVEKSVR